MAVAVAELRHLDGEPTLSSPWAIDMAKLTSRSSICPSMEGNTPHLGRDGEGELRHLGCANFDLMEQLAASLSTVYLSMALNPKSVVNDHGRSLN
jgi:hypothetical protein